MKNCTCDTHKTCPIHNPLTDNIPATDDRVKEQGSHAAEWTVERLSNYRDPLALCRDINAELAAERKKVERLERMLDLAGAQNMGINNLAKLDELQQQLAAEKEKVENLHQILGKKRTEIKQLKDKNAIEAHKRKAEDTPA
jgi:reverse gyrase